MRKFSSAILRGAALLALMAVLNGCDKHNRDGYYEQPVYVEAAKPYEIVDNKDKGIKYAVLQQGSVLPDNVNGWKALSPEFFTKLSGIEVKAPEEDKTPHPGRGVFRPIIEKSEKYPERQITTIYMGGMVPKEMNGWVAITHEALVNLSKSFLEADAKK